MAKRSKATDRLEMLISDIRDRYSRIRKGSSQEEVFLLHLRSLGQWNEDLMDYPNDADPEFPESIPVAHAVCHPHCGVAEFIVEGSTQECQHCGGHLFRTATCEYIRKKTD